MEIEELVALVVPPADYQHRNGFNNIPLISKLTKDEKTQLEDALISKLTNESKVSIDTLIIETLAFLKSEKSLPILKQLLGASSNNLTRLKIAASIFEIGKENDMIDIAIGLVGKIDDKNDAYYVHKLTSAFYYLMKFRSSKVNDIIQKYTNHEEYLVAYNARQVLDELSA